MTMPPRNTPEPDAAVRSGEGTPESDAASGKPNPFELILSILTLAFGIATFLHALTLPGGLNGPIGPSAVPLICSILLIVFSLAFGARAIIALGRKGASFFSDLGSVRVLWAPLGLTVLYVLVMNPLGYLVSTIGFLAILGIILAKFSPRSVLFSIGLAVVLGFGLEHVFTQYLVLDLP